MNININLSDNDLIATVIQHYINYIRTEDVNLTLEDLVYSNKTVKSLSKEQCKLIERLSNIKTCFESTYEQT